jgi:hypothetical protein
MKIFISLLVLVFVSSCGNSIKNRSEVPTKRHSQSHLSEAETWTILSEHPLPLKVRVLINELEFFNECKSVGRGLVERTETNGAVHIYSYQAFRQEFFDIDIYDCEDNTKFFSGAYIDQQLIEHPVTGEISIILRLRN